MFWLAGGKAFVVAVASLWGLEFVRYQLSHSDWEGVRYYDVIWPSFMLMVGVSLPFSFAKRALVQTRSQITRDVWRRAAVLFLLGSLRESLSTGAPALIELSSALQPIALAYVVTSYLVERPVKAQIAVGAGILAGYALLLALVPAPGIPAGTYEKGRNLVTAVDWAVLGRSHAEGWGTVLSAIPTISTTILGLLLGRVLTSDATKYKKMLVIGATGAGCLSLGFAISPVIPVIMKLWTTSYALITAGWACLLFLLFYWITDVRQNRRWSFPLVVIGTNALAAYLLPAIIPVHRIAGTFTKPIAATLGVYGPTFSAAAVLVVSWLILFWMYQRRLCLKA
jgi:predicted acyltransferase